jgi:ubiquinone/menaquinone biosynthesis C-methylase UbiE
VYEAEADDNKVSGQIPPRDFDVYQGVSWAERARHGVFGIALDYGDRIGKKNRFMDAVHQTGIRNALRSSGRSFRRALDFGCGGGRLLPLLKDYAAEVYGVDRTQECLDIARTQKTIPDERLICWRNGSLPFADGFFDLVLCVYVLLTREALEALTSEMSRVCRSGGTALVLEQADNGRGLTIDRYNTTFAQAGFVVKNAQALRRSSGSRAMKLATQSWSTPWLSAFAVRWELGRMKSARYDERTAGYFDYLFVLKKN